MEGRSTHFTIQQRRAKLQEGEAAERPKAGKKMELGIQVRRVSASIPE
jgi:hypothetical protein